MIWRKSNHTHSNFSLAQDYRNMAQLPEHDDSEYNLLLKIAENFGVIVNKGDSKQVLLYKIAKKTYELANGI